MSVRALQCAALTLALVVLGASPAAVDARAPLEAPRVSSLQVDGAWLPVPPPGPRTQHTAVLDPPRARLLVFGGSGANAVFDVWAYELDEGVWTQVAVSGTSPTPRSRHTAVYDAAADRMIVFGGQDANGVRLGDVWALSLSGGAAWSLLSPGGAGPSARVDHGAIYDPVRGRMVVFGGFDTGHLNDVHAFDLAGASGWTVLSPTGAPPAARRGHAVLYDPPRDRMLVCAGAGASLYNDVWELSLAGAPAWATVAAGGSVPVPRSEHAVVYDALRDRMVLVAGLGGTGERSEVRALSLSGAPTWSVLFPAGAFTARAGHAALYDPIGDRMVVHGGGTGGGSLDELWFLPFGTMGWTSDGAAKPWDRRAHGAIYDPLRRRMVILAGSGPAEARTHWALHLDGEPWWEPLTPTGPAPSYRENYSAVLDPARDRVLVFGGAQYVYGPSFNEVWALSLEGQGAWTQLQPLGTPPNPRNGHVAIYDPVADRMIVFGGRDAAYQSQLWALELDPVPQWTQLTATGADPAAWVERSAIYDPVRHRMIVFGGGDYPATNDVFALSLSGPPVWTFLAPVGGEPRRRCQHVAVYDEAGDRMVIYGGNPTDSLGQLADVWALALSGSPSWTQLTPAGPSPGAGSERAAIYDPVRRAMVVNGGSSGSSAGTTWGLFWNDVLDIGERWAPGFELAQSRPNPARSRLAIDFELAAPGSIALTVHDLQGRAVRTLAQGVHAAGRHHASWDLAGAHGTKVPPGVYLYRLTVGGRTFVRRAVVLGGGGRDRD